MKRIMFCLMVPAVLSITAAIAHGDPMPASQSVAIASAASGDSQANVSDVRWSVAPLRHYTYWGGYGWRYPGYYRYGTYSPYDYYGYYGGYTPGFYYQGPLGFSFGWTPGYYGRPYRYGFYERPYYWRRF